MASQRQGSRNSDVTAVAQPVNSEKVKDPSTLNNPLQTPKKSHSQKKEKDTEAYVTEKTSSISESSIKVKQLTWLEAAGLLFTEYIVIAILSFPSSYSVLGLAGGVIATVLIGLAVLYTSHVLWRYCMSQPGATDICDLSSRLFPEKWRKVAWAVTSIAFILNNLFVMGLHTLAGAVALNTLSNHAICTVAFSVIMTVAMLILSIPRELNQVAIMGFVAAATMFIAFLLCLVFLGIEENPAGYTAGAVKTVRVWAAPGTTFTEGFNAFLNILYTYVGHILIPSYVDDMKKPEDFPKALYLCTFLEIVIFTLGGAIGYHYIGDQFMTSPAYGSLREPYVKIVSAFTLPTLLIVGVLYANVTGRFVFLRIFPVDSIHRLEHTVKGWTVWLVIITIIFIIAFVIGSAIPFFNELLSLMSSLFDWYFGFVLEALAFFHLYKRGQRFTTPLRSAETCLNVLMMVAGLFTLGGGAYSSINAIRLDFVDGSVESAFSCANNGF